MVKHIRKWLIAPNYNYISVINPLSANKSESFVKYTANIRKIKEALSKNRSHGILKFMKSREEFLMDKNYEIHIVLHQSTHRG